MNFSFFYVADNELIRRVNLARGSVAPHALDVSVACAWPDGAGHTTLGYGRSAPVTLVVR